MINRDIVSNNLAINKLRETSLLPWEDVLETADFFADIDRAAETYNKANTNLQLKYARFGLKNIEDLNEQKANIEGNEENDEEDNSDKKIDPALLALSSDGLKVEQLASRDTETNELNDRETGNIRLPSIDIKVIKKLYDDSKSRREKEISTAGKKEKENPKVKEEPYFTTDDIRAYIVLGITAKAEKKAQG